MDQPGAALLVRGLMGEGELAGEGSKYFEQTLDHASQYDRRTFQQQYFMRDEYFRRADAPLFVYLGGEAPLYGPPKRGSFVDVLARTAGALLFALEHRFYGESIPFATLSTANLRYLTTQQAVHDVASGSLLIFPAGHARQPPHWLPTHCPTTRYLPGVQADGAPPNPSALSSRLPRTKRWPCAGRVNATNSRAQNDIV